MKNTGIVRQIDNLGRLVLPKELRTTNKITKGDPMEIFIEGKDIILRKYEPSCIFCGEANDVIEFKGRKICQTCYNSMQNHPDFQQMAE